MKKFDDESAKRDSRLAPNVTAVYDHLMYRLQGYERVVMGAGLYCDIADATAAIVHGVQSALPWTRVLVGADAHVIKATVTLLPDFALDWIQRAVMWA